MYKQFKNIIHYWKKIDPQRLHKFLFILFFILILLPCLQQNFSLFRVKRLRGTFEEVEKPQLTFVNYKSGEYQRQAENYLSSHFGFREIALRWYNQYLWSAFRKTYVNWVKLGKEDWLYYRHNIEEYYQGLSYSYFGSKQAAEDTLRLKAQKIRQIQQILEKNGTYFTFCFYPSKEMIVPEYLPENRCFFNKKEFCAYQFLKSQFDSLDVNYIDFCGYFLAIKDTVSYPLFTQTGTHWSNISAVRSADSLIRYFEDKLAINMRNLILVPPVKSKLYEPDADLEELLNLVFPIPKPRTMGGKIGVDNDITAVKPKFINIGDSFFWNIANMIPRDSIFDPCHYWYYNSTIYFDSLHVGVQELNYAQELVSADIVMLSYNTSQLYELKGDFPTMALNALVTWDSISARSKILP